MTSLCVLMASLLVGTAPPADAWQVPITVQEYGGVARVREPVVSGIPFPKGVLADPGKVVLYAGDGRPRPPAGGGEGRVPAAFKALSRWEDGSVKWLLVQFAADVPAKETRFFLLGPGAPTPVEGLSVKDGPEAVVINTGVLQLTVPKDRFAILSPALYGGKPILTGGDLVLTDAAGKTFRTAAAKPAVTVEEGGPFRTVVCLEGPFVAEDGTDFSARVRAKVRLYAFAYSSQVRLQVYLMNQNTPGPGGRGKGEGEPLRFKGLSLQFAHGLRGGVGCLEDRSSAPLARGLSLYQTRQERKPGHEEHNIFYELTIADQTTEGKRASGLIDIAGPTAGVTAGIRHFWQQYPKRLAADDASLALDLWPIQPERLKIVEKPADSGFVRLAYYEGTDYVLREGQHRCHEVVLDFHNGPRRPAMRDLAVACEYPLFGLAPVDWVCDSMALGRLVPPRPEGLAPQLDGLFEMYHRYVMCKVDRSVCADESSAYNPHVKLANDLYMARETMSGGWKDDTRIGRSTWYGWVDFGDIPWADGYTVHYEWPYLMLLHFLRTGDYRLFDLGEEMAVHLRDMDHYHPTGVQTYQKGRHSNVSHGSHTWIRGLILHHLLTGDPESRAVAEQVGREIMTHPSSGTGTEVRFPGWECLLLSELYLAFGEKAYLETARQIAHNCVKNKASNLGDGGYPTAFGIGSSGRVYVDGKRPQCVWMFGILTQGLGRYWDATGDATIADYMREISDWHIRETRGLSGIGQGEAYRPMLLASEWWSPGIDSAGSAATSLFVPDGLAYTYLITGDRTYLDYAFWIMRDAYRYLQGPTINCWSRLNPGSENKIQSYVSRTGQNALWCFANAVGDRPPTAPLYVGAVPADRGAKVEWLMSLGATGYRLERAAGEGAFAPVGAEPIAATSRTDAGLTNGVKYRYRVAAVSASGQGPFSEPVTVTPVANPSSPPAPGAIRLEAGNRAVKLVWDAVPGADYYEILHATPSRPQEYDFSVVGVTADTEFIDGTTWMGEGSHAGYWFHVVACNQVGRSPLGPRAGPIHPDDAKPPYPPVLRARLRDGKVWLTWLSKCMRPVDFDVYRSEMADGEYVKLGTTQVPGMQFLDANVQSGRTYFYRATCRTRENDKRGGSPVRESAPSASISIRVP